MTTIGRTTPRTAIVFGHADGDGYLAAEVSRENLVTDGWTVTNVVVDPKKTPNYRFWEGHFQDWDFSYVDLVVIVDIAFNFKEPARSCEALSHHADKFPNTRFLVIDHHPLEAGMWLAKNVTLKMVSSVFQCCYGNPNDLMVIASICDKDEEPVKHLIAPSHRILAAGVNRAASDVGGVAGETLLTMLHNRQLAWLFTLGSEPKEFHRTYYGRRVKNGQPSPTLQSATK